MYVLTERIITNMKKIEGKMCQDLSIPARQIVFKQLSKIDADIESLIQDIGYLILVEIDADYGIKCKEK